MPHLRSVTPGSLSFERSSRRLKFHVLAKSSRVQRCSRRENSAERRPGMNQESRRRKGYSGSTYFTLQDILVYRADPF